MRKFFILFFLIFPIIILSSKVDNTLEKQLYDLDDSNNDILRIIVLNGLIEQYTYSNPMKALYYGKLAKKIVKDRDDHIDIATTYKRLAKVYLYQGCYDLSLQNYQKSLEICKKINIQSTIAYALDDLGYYYIYQGINDVALQYFNRAAEIFRKNKYEEGLAKTYNDIGLSYRNMSKSEAATEYFNKALKLYNKFKNKTCLGQTYTYLGFIEEDKQNYQQALKIYQRALKIFTEVDDKLYLALTFKYMGNTYQKEEFLSSSLKYYQKSLSIFQEIDNKNEISDMMILIAKLYNKKKDYKQSINFGKKALKISKENGLLEQQQKSCFLLSDNYLILKEYKKSLESFKQYNIIQSSIFNKKIAKTISDLEVRHATEKEKKENEILKKDKAILELKFKILIIILFFGILLIILLYIRYCEKVKLNQQIEKQKEELRIVNLKQEELLEQLEKLNATKNKFFSIIAHDLKNSFHALLAGSRLLSVDIDNLDKKLIKTLGRELKISADNLYKLLDNLLKWARVQIDVIQYAPTKIQLSEIIEENFNLLNGKSIDKKIDMISEVDRNIFVYADRNMLNSVLQNLVFNALKFTHPGGKITINSIKKDDYIQVDVKDSGIGISEKTINKLFKIDIHISTPGTANEKGTGLGLILCKEFIEKNGGKIWIKSEFGKGSIFSFTLPAFSEENKKINSA